MAHGGTLAGLPGAGRPGRRDLRPLGRTVARRPSPVARRPSPVARRPSPVALRRHRARQRYR
ncbi:hypothetical protein DN051_03780 [Streptomyces cadmiisoli]|uniref:Uncharacterized protein n=1 Tax=Streptomyces cadmiisoli TaxID=2184053 RepID=A0A2Z4IT74_9ACTN|nr:hypothetical protein DN051_03780 [Streptomyces cadmiisoli]